MLGVSAHNSCLVLLLIVGCDLNLPRSLNHMIVGEDVAFPINDKSRSLALLRHRAIEEVIGDCGGSDIYHAGQRFLVDSDVLLLLSVIAGRRGGLSKFNMCGPRDPPGLEDAVGMGGEVVEA